MVKPDTIIYADIYLIINFCIDFTCIYISTAILKLPKKAWRLTAASLFGAIYALSALYYNYIILHIVASLLLCIIAVKGTIFEMIKLWILFIITSLLFGGLFTALYIQAESNGATVAVALPAAAIIAYLYGKLIKKRASIKTARLKLIYKGKETTITGFVDSGNLLCDPISGDNVVLIKSQVLNNFCNIDENCVGIRFIPMTTAVGSTLMKGFRPDSAEIKTLLSKKAAKKKIIVAIDESPGTYCGFLANIPAEIL